MSDCDSFALLQMRPASSITSTTSFSSFDTPSTSAAVAVSMATNNALVASLAGVANAHYHLRLPVNGFYYLTVYAAYDEVGTISTGGGDHLECVYRILIDARRPSVASGGGGGMAPAFPKQTYW